MPRPDASGAERGARRGRAPFAATGDQTTAWLGGRLSAVLYLVCGALLEITTPLLPVPPGANRTGLIVLATIAVAMGAAIGLVPWGRWPRAATLWLVPPTFTLIGLYNAFAADDGYRYATFFFLTFAWIGMIHRRGTSALFAPLACAAYLAPLAGGPHWNGVCVSSVVYVLPACVLLGEAVAWVSDRLGRAQRSLEDREASFRKLFSENPQPMWVYDLETLEFLEVNAAAIAHYGYNRDEFLSMRITDVRPAEDVGTVLATLAEARPALDHARSWRHVCKGGRIIDVDTTSHRLDFGGRNAVLVAIQDVTERNTLERQLRHRAFHDSLTELANRSLFGDRVEHALAVRDRTEGSLAVVVLDLDFFKNINDSLGHTAGDDLLIAVAQRMRDKLRRGDTAARLGGDEFAILFEDVAGVDDASNRAERLLVLLKQPFDIAGKQLVVTASAGVAVNRAGDRAEELVRNADMAMYLAKSNGKACVRVFEPAMHDAALARLELEAELHRALSRHELVLHYQPTVHLATGAVSGLEALVRWQHPRRGLLAPSEFIPLAEDTGLIIGLGHWVLGQACRQLRAWQERHPTLELSVAVNLSVRQFADPRLVDDVAATLVASGLDPHSLALEITETALADDAVSAIQCLDRLKALGVRIAIDDFGTGYSSLSYLRSLPIDILKIDKAFIDGVASDAESAGLVEAILQMASTLDLETVAEGVETVDQAHALERLGSRLVQGFYFAPPLEPEAVDAFLARAAEHARVVARGSTSLG